ncbi:hypothetical protein MKZ38_009303 [Zalerion maritima]|uniref:dihydroneopterin aldolase n=1 Tax=Zalerion maritima TaxID=339359 RepID=A0AAD5WT19_9PEZI|nr:hypothetical protein MKZ38_009303 [Zalerion maritima]
MPQSPPPLRPLLIPPPSSQVHLRNLRATTIHAHDAWNRSRKPQPLLISISIGLSQPFSTSSAPGDVVDSSTVHYGHLAKGVSSWMDEYESPPLSKAPGGGTVGMIMEHLFAHLTGLKLPSSSSSWPSSSQAQLRPRPQAQPQTEALPQDQDGEQQQQQQQQQQQPLNTIATADLEHLPPFLTLSRLHSLAITLSLPKASLLGSRGVFLTTTAVFDPSASGAPSLINSQLAVRGIQMPTLIGVNANERTAKQVLIADVEIENFRLESGDVYVDVERVVSEMMEQSSFETLEALGTLLAEKVISYVPPLDKRSGRDIGWQVKISLEKPMAVPLADAPIVEVIVR